MISHICEELAHLKREMQSKGLAPDRPITPDGKRHIYTVTFNGTPRDATYIASTYPFGSEGPVLLCTYSFMDEVQQYGYQSPLK